MNVSRAIPKIDMASRIPEVNVERDDAFFAAERRAIDGLLHVNVRLPKPILQPLFHFLETVRVVLPVHRWNSLSTSEKIKEGWALGAPSGFGC